MSAILDLVRFGIAQKGDRRDLLRGHIILVFI